MRISATRLLSYRLPFRRPWRTHRGVLRERAGWLLELTTDQGLRGYGDCAPLPQAGTEIANAAGSWLRARISKLAGSPLLDVLDALPRETKTPAARHALESALLDLVSQAEGLSLRRWLSPTAVDDIRVNAACGALDGEVHKRCERSVQLGFKTLKLKVGLDEVRRELELLRGLSAVLPEATDLRLDANGAWTSAEARQFLSGLQGLPVESLEEPLSDPSVANLRDLQDSTPVALALDESQGRFTAAELYDRLPVRRLILKPCVLGGLLPTRHLAERAMRAGMETLITSTLESAVGIQAAAQLAMALYSSANPLAQGLATSDWFAENVTEPPPIVRGRLQLRDAAGLGIRLTHLHGETF